MIFGNASYLSSSACFAQKGVHDSAMRPLANVTSLPAGACASAFLFVHILLSSSTVQRVHFVCLKTKEVTEAQLMVVRCTLELIIAAVSMGQSACWAYIATLLWGQVSVVHLGWLHVSDFRISIFAVVVFYTTTVGYPCPVKGHP